jgi:hypothetical protein
VARIEKQGKVVQLTMTVDEVILLESIIEAAGNLAARVRARSGNNTRIRQEADIRMTQLWSLSDHLSVPDDESASYVQDFRLP